MNVWLGEKWWAPGLPHAEIVSGFHVGLNGDSGYYSIGCKLSVCCINPE